MATWWISWVAMISTLFGAGDTHPACLTLGGLDVQRAAAFSTGSTAPLSQVYADEAARVGDRVMVRDYRVRGLRLVGMAMQRSSCRLAGSAPRRLRLDVVDVLGPTWAVDASGTAERLPQDRPTRHVVTLVQHEGRWFIDSVER